MPKIPFIKYHGAGNDFILIDDRSGIWNDQVNEAWISRACHRRFGIGADGLILLQSGMDGADFFMKYFNSDGRPSSFCGNGGRCIVSFAAQLGMHDGQTRFLGTDGWHSANLRGDGIVELGMLDVNEIRHLDDNTYQLYTGSPHFVTFVSDVDHVDVRNEGRAIRNSPPFSVEGINVNFVESMSAEEIKMRTYERGVEDETMACGTGVVAAAIANAYRYEDHSGKSKIHVQGGDLIVAFERKGDMDFVDVRLIGPAVEVFRGEIEID